MNAFQPQQTDNAVYDHALSLLRSAIASEPLSRETAAFCTPSNLEQLYELANRHDLAHLAALALSSARLPDSDIMQKFHAGKMRAIYRYVRLDYDYQQICHILESAQIPFLPLKGAVLRAYYPEPWMRTSCDVDILVRQDSLDAARDALTAHGWVVRGKMNYHDISLYSPNGVHLELHFHIKENMPNIDPVLETVWQHSHLLPGTQYEYRQSNAFFLFHHIAHMSYHFVSGGCGIRPFLDLWLLTRQMPYDGQAFRKLCADAHLETFYGCAVDLANVWFGKQPHSAITKQMEHYILSGGTYGTLSNKVIMTQATAGSRWKNLFRRIFMPYQHIIIKYPLLKKYKWLTPFFQVVRWIQLLTQKKLGHSLRELNHIRQTSDLQISDAEAFLIRLGLKS